MMNPEAQAHLDGILAKGPDSVTEEDMGFLRARRSYLTGEQKVNFGIEEPGEQTEPSPYEAMKLAELKAELETRGVEFDPKAKKPALIALLEEADQNQE